MRILFDSKLPQFKDPFGTLVPGQNCRLHIHIPSAVQASGAKVIINYESGEDALTVDMAFQEQQDGYDIFRGDFALEQTALYFYHFQITTAAGTFRLFKQGDDTNMEAGDSWQVSCVPENFHVPQWAKGAVIYQIFPDRFHKSGKCDLTGKMEPYTLHTEWNAEVSWQPTDAGVVLNNDFFGCNFRGIMEKLDHLASLGVTIIYLNPISKSFSNHRYDTGDYMVPDPMLGTEADFTALCDAAHKKGMKVILDGVYSHTGSDSLYFDREGRFDSVGAYESKESPYYRWYDFHEWPNSYSAWWNINTLPTVDKLEKSFTDYIIDDEDSVIAHWLRAGADGFRLDVADELPDAFIRRLKTRMHQVKPDSLLIGEVWEDASNKVAYGSRRRYFTDGELDSVMNYPLRTAILDFIRGMDSGCGLKNAILTLAENYPPEVFQSNMNLLGTHDTPRILTALVDNFEGNREEQSKRFLSQSQYLHAQERLILASFLQYTLPGSPSIYYADEAGAEGYKDPFNRRPYPWGREDHELLDHFRRLGQLRQACEALRLGDIQFFKADHQMLGFTRSYQGQTLRVYLNRSDDLWKIAPGRVLLAHNMRTVAPDGMTLGAKGFCVMMDW